MKKFLLTLLLACGAASVSFGGEFEDCLKECKAKNIGNALANFECQNTQCKHLNPNSKDSAVNPTGGTDTTGAKGGFTNNKAKSSGGGIYIKQ